MRVSFLIFILLAVNAFAGENNFSKQNLDSDKTGNTNPVQFNSEKYNLLHETDEQAAQEFEMTASRKSGVKAAFLSALVPGAGEVYAKSYWRAAIFAGVEIALWSLNISYDNKGDKEDKRMRAFGDEHWSEETYWSKLYGEGKANPSLADQIPDYSLDENNRIIGFDSDVANSLRFLERELGYTHSLPETKTQQYYEMIYKYLHQFGSAWDDVPYIEFYDNVSNLGNLTPNMETYRSMRNRSNDYYQNATNMLNLALLNHVLSAFDAALAVKQFNKKVNYALRADRQLHGYEYVTTYGLYLSW